MSSFVLSALITPLHFSRKSLFVSVRSSGQETNLSQSKKKSPLTIPPSQVISFFILDWRDAELMRDIEAATGHDLGSDRVGKKGKGKKKKKKFPNLSDLKQNANTSRSRLEKKVFNKYVISCHYKNSHIGINMVRSKDQTHLNKNYCWISYLVIFEHIWRKGCSSLKQNFAFYIIWILHR